MPALLVLAALAAAPAFAADPAELAEGVLDERRPGPRAAGSIGEPGPRGRPRWTDERTFRGPFGLLLDAGCAPWEGAEPPAPPARFSAAVEAMHRGLQECARTRVLPASAGLVYRVMDGARLSCDPEGCADIPPPARPGACAHAETRTIVFKSSSAYADPGVLFHELGHLTRAMDNQDMRDHNEGGRDPLRDELYFWEGHCFGQPALVRDLRERLRASAREAGLSYGSSGDLPRVRELAFDACAGPFSVRESAGRAYFSGPEVEAVCRQYAEFLMMEINLGRLLREGLLPLAGDCRPERDGIPCPGPEFFDPGSPQASALRSLRVVLPRLRPYSEEAFAEWAEAACGGAPSEAARRAPAKDIASCARRQAERLEMELPLGTVRAAGLSDSDAEAVIAYLDLLSLKARVLVEGPNRYEGLPSQEDPEANARRTVIQVLSRCQDPRIAGSTLCAQLGPESPAIRLMASLLLHWAPRRLPP